MAVFQDDFNRANGALGGHWTVIGANATISSNSVVFQSISAAFNTTINSTSYQEASARCSWNTLTFAGPGVGVCIDAAGAGGFFMRAEPVAGVPAVRIRSGGVGGVGYLAHTALALPVPPMFTLKLTWEAGVLKGYVDGALLVETQSALYPEAPYMGIGGYAAYGAVLDCVFVTDEAIGLEADPAVIGNYGECTAVTLTGTNTAWTVGQPGAPTFTVNHGTITAQEVLTATTATLTYCPGSYLGAITFTDPSTGATAGAVVTSDPALVPPTGTQFSAAAIAYIERSALAEADAYILNTTTLVGGQGEQTGASLAIGDIRLSAYRNTWSVEGEPSTARLLYILFGLLSGYHPPREGAFTAPSTTTLKEDLDAIQLALDTLITANNYTLGTTITTLTGEGAKTHLDILDAIGAIEPGGETDLSPVLDAIATLRGDEIATVAQLVDILGQIRTVSTYHFGSVKGWVEAVQGPNAPTIHDVRDDIAALVIPPAADLEPVLEAVADGTAVAQLAVDALTLFLDPEGATVQLILDAIAALAPSGTAGPPVWPGVANATLGDELALTDGRVIPGPLDGILVHITSVPPRAGQYGFGATTSWAHVGAVLFRSDQGAFETAQQIAVEEHVLCPKAMRQASSATIRINSGFGGTVTPWLVTL